jgi:FkbM family methyltransferase
MKNPNAIINSNYGPIIINVYDKYIGGHISKLGYWAEDDINVIFELMIILLKKKESIMFYDVGANIGTHSLALHKLLNGKIRIRAFEAQRQVFNMLCGTMAINGISNVHCYNNAVSDIDGNSISIRVPDYMEINNFGGLEIEKALLSDNQSMIFTHTEFVKTITLDSFNEPVDFVKIDIEGMEEKAINGMKNLINSHRPIMFIEISKSNSNNILNFFKSLKYSCHIKSGDAIFSPIEYGIEINSLNKLY